MFSRLAFFAFSASSNLSKGFNLALSLVSTILSILVSSTLPEAKASSSGIRSNCAKISIGSCPLKAAYLALASAVAVRSLRIAAFIREISASVFMPSTPVNTNLPSCSVYNE